MFVKMDRVQDTGPVKSMKDDDPIFIDVGIYGFCAKEDFDREATHKRLERFAIDHKGYQASIFKAFFLFPLIII